MEFGPVPLERAEGAILGHSVRLAGRKLVKGQVLGPGDLEAIRAAGLHEVTVARLAPGDVPESEAARRVAEALLPDAARAGLRLTAPHAGRVNLHADRPGLVALEADQVLRLNLVDPGLTLATLAPLVRVTPGMLVGTVKVIPYAVPGAAVAQACAAAQGAGLRVLPVVLRSAALILSEVEGEPAKLADKAERAVRGRLTALGMQLTDVTRVPHRIATIERALLDLDADLGLILTGAATSDLFDTAPEALRRAGGQVIRFGMPVDPGNLLFHGTLGGRPVIGLPGCARAPALNGADWVLERLACGLDLPSAAIAAMGVGGLLKEIPLRPQPRERGRRD